jgi:hypothetical protein
MSTPVVADRVMRARRSSICPDCQEPIKPGQLIARRGYWMHARCLIDHQRIKGAAMHADPDLIATETRRGSGDEICGQCKTPIGRGMLMSLVPGTGWCHLVPCITGGKPPMCGPSTGV